MAFRTRCEELSAFTGDPLRPPTPFRLYQARVSEHSVLIRGSDPRFGRGIDTREPVDLTGAGAGGEIR